MKYNDRIIARSTLRAVTLDQVRDYLSIISTSDDEKITRLLDAAIDYVEGQTGVAMLRQTREVVFDEFDSSLRLPRAPLVSVDSVKYLDANFAEQTVDQSSYYVDTASVPGAVVFKPSFSLPVLASAGGAVRVRYVCGPDTIDLSSRDLPLAVMQLVRHWYDNPAPINVGNITTPLPHALDALLWINRII